MRPKNTMTLWEKEVRQWFSKGVWQFFWDQKSFAGAQVGQNPLGTRMSLERYEAVYELCACLKRLLCKSKQQPTSAQILLRE